jgi:hypothetical protein
MRKLTFTSFLLFSSVASAAQLTETETRWLTAGLPVLAYAKQELKLPIDIVVQPQAKPGDVPLALGFADGRCKLVLSMRGNPQAEAVLDALPAEQHQLMIEAMTAHEIGHCWRYAQGVWHALPAGFVEGHNVPAVPPDLRQLAQSILETRREEGYADLVALAWTQQRHPGQYAQVAAWLNQVRQPLAQEGDAGSHDTRAWLRLAPTGSAFNPAQPLFEQAAALWRKGLLTH